MEKKNLTIFFNCFGNYIYFYLKKYLPSNYNIKWIYIAVFEGGGGNRKFFNKEEIDILNNTDILIVQYIKNDREFLNHDKVIKLTNDSTIIIKIPHYTYYGYNYKILSDNILKNIDKNYNTDELKKNIDFKYKEERNINIENYNKYKFDCLENIKLNDKYSDIKLYDIFKHYYNTNILFLEPWHPSSFLIYLMVIEVLKYLRLEYKQEYISVCEIFSSNQLNLDKNYIELHYVYDNLLKINYFYKNLQENNIFLYENYLFNGYNNILYNPIEISIKKNDINSIKKLSFPNDNIIEIYINKNKYYTSTFIKEKINIENYIYFHSDLISELEEVSNESILRNYKEHPSCCLLNKKNYLLINKISN